MPRILVATADEALQQQLDDALVRQGQGLGRVTDWDGLVGQLARPELALVLVDAELPGLDAELLVALARSLSRKPELRCIGQAPPLKTVRLDRLGKLLGKHGRKRVRGELRELRLLGLGPNTDALLAEAASGLLPVLITGGRGTGKVRLARHIHELSGRPGAFREARERLPTLEGPPGTAYLAAGDKLSDGHLIGLAQQASEQGWVLIASGRSTRPIAPTGWRHLDLEPLRARPEELRKLALLYLDRYRRQLGLPRRRFDRALWALLRAHRWPGNAQELEGFVVQTLTNLPGPILRARDLSPRLRALVEPALDEALVSGVEGFEELVEGRLRGMVDQLEPGDDVDLHSLVISATERALIRLALARTGGNQKAAAQLLGVARNTLRTKGIALGLIEPLRRTR